MVDNIISSADLLPKFSIRRVIVSETAEKAEVKLLCALNRPRELNYENWIGTSEFSPYIKYYFIASNKNLSNAHTLGISNPADRINYISSLGGGLPMQTWETNLGPQNAIQRADGRPNPFAFCGWTSRSLQEILQGQYFINDPLVAFEGAEPMHPDAMDDPEKYNTYFEINLELIGDGKNAVLGPLSAARLDIYAFSQVDILAIQEQFNINEPEFLASLGSSIIIENCLVKDKLNQYNTNLKVAETRKAYFTENDILYQGKVHYHGATNPGPGGYIGWMAGLRDGPMGTKLSVRDIPNNKVTYKSSTQRAVNYEGTPLTANNFFSGFTMNPQVFAADDGLLSFGDNVREALLSHLGHIGAIGPQISDLESQQNIETLGRYQRYSNKLRELVISSLRRGSISSGQGRSWIDVNENRSFHGSVLWLNLAQIVADNSRFGYLYALHKDKRNSADILRRMIMMSTIKDFSIRRQRITNDPIINNLASSPARDAYDNNEVNEIVIRTSKSSSDGVNVIDSFQNQKARIFEVGPSRDTTFKGIILEDYDLFENYHYGQYRYLIDLTLEDGILKALELLHDQFEIVLKNFSDYLYEAQRPYLDYRDSGYYNGSQFADGQRDQQDREQARTFGNYIHSTDSFTPQFRQRGAEFSQTISDMVEGYVFMYYILTARDTFNQEMADQIKRDLMPESATLGGIEYFHNLCNKLYSTLTSFINMDKNTKRLPSPARGQVNIENSHRFPDRLIRVSGESKAKAKAVVKNSVFLRPNIAANAARGLRRVEAVNVRDFVSFDLSIALGSDNSGILLDSNIGTTDRIYDLQTIHDETVDLPPERGPDPRFRIAAALEASRTGRALVTTNGVFDEMRELDNLLTQYGGATIESMAAKVGIFEDTSLSTDIKTLSISKNLQASIVESITKTGNSKAFEAEMEEKYKDYLLNKEALGDMFDVVKNAVSRIRTQKNITLSSKYKDKVLANRSEKSNKVEKENTINNNKDIVKNQRFLPYTFNTSGELIEAKDSGQYGIVVFLKEGDNFEDAVLASNVSIVQSSANSNSSSSPRLSSSRANTSQSSGNTQNNSTSTSTY